jgi:hypothetical protein
MLTVEQILNKIFDAVAVALKVDQKLPTELISIIGTTSATPGEITTVDLSDLGTVVGITVACPECIPDTEDQSAKMLQFNLDDIEENAEFPALFPGGSISRSISRTSVRLKSLNASAPYVVLVAVR